MVKLQLAQLFSQRQHAIYRQDFKDSSSKMSSGAFSPILNTKVGRPLVNICIKIQRSVTMLFAWKNDKIHTTTW